MKRKKVFFAVLNWGMGHATRSLPLMREFIDRDWELLVGGSGRALHFLSRELPAARFEQTPDYDVRYSRDWLVLPKLLSQAPKIIRAIDAEQEFCQQIAASFQPDLIVSDNCYGMYHQSIPSYFISHQIHFAMPRGFDYLRPLFARFNFSYHRHYRRVFIPDEAGPNGGLLSGILGKLPKDKANYEYIGVLSSLERSAMQQPPLDLLAAISGPEPQRTLFEEKVLSQIDRIPGNKVVVLGKSESTAIVSRTDSLKIYNHLPRAELGALMNRAKIIISRSGYSTLLELVELGKKALFIPTPGQTEQVYLGRRLRRDQLFYSVSQQDLDLKRDLKIAETFPGLKGLPRTSENVHRVFTNHFEKLGQAKMT